MKHITRIILSFYLLMLSLVAWSSESIKYNVFYLNMANGLPNNYVDDIFQDTSGFTWICTRGGGLLRYDGYSLVNYSLTSKSGLYLLTNSCRNVTEDKFGRIWVACDEGVQSIDNRIGQVQLPEAINDKLKKKLEAVTHDPCVRVYCDTKGFVWILKFQCIDRIGFDKDGKVNSILSVKHDTKVPDLAIADLDNNGSVYVGLNRHLSRVRYAGGKLVLDNLSSRYPQLSNRIIGAIVRWNGKIWFGTDNGLYNSDKNFAGIRYNGTPKGLSHNNVTSLASTANGKYLMIGTLDGVDFLDKKGDISYFKSTDPVNPLSSDFVNNILVTGHQAWIGTETGGITRVSPRHLLLTNYTHNDGNKSTISPNAVNAMWAAPNGDLWAGTVEGGLNWKKAGSDTFIHFTSSNSGLTHNSVSVLCSDGKYLWIGTWGGGLSYMPLDEPGKITPLIPDNSHAANMTFIGALAVDKYNHGLWIGSNSGLYFYDYRTKKITDPFPGCRNINGSIGSIVTREGVLLMGCIPGMVSVDLKRGRDKRGYFHSHRFIHKLDQPETGAFDKIQSFCQGHDGTLWIGSSGYGLYRAHLVSSDSIVCKNYVAAEGLANNFVKGIVMDSKGILWIATEHGLSTFDPKRESFNNSYEEDGLLSSQFYFNGAILGKNGTIWLGTDKGLTALYGIDYNAITTGHLTFTSLIVNNQFVFAGSDYIDQDISVAKKITLHQSDRSFEIDFSALDYHGERQGSYFYRMKGYDDKWIALAPGEHSVRYTTLPVGSYTFEVRYSSSLGHSRMQTASIDVTVTPYFYNSGWFRILVLIVIAILLRYAYKRKLNKMREHETELLYRPIEAALKDSPDPDKLQERIQTILRNQDRYQESQRKTVEADTEQIEKKNKNQTSLMTKLMTVMENKYADPQLSVGTLAQELGVNRSELSKTLQTELGVSTSQFVRNYRLDVAKRFLEDNVAARNITEIAYRVGFNDPKYFTRCFTQRFGVAPSAYKKG